MSDSTSGQSRRSFLKKAIAGTSVLAVSLPLASDRAAAFGAADHLPIETNAIPADACDVLHDICCGTCRALPLAPLRAVCYAKCMSEYAACRAAMTLLRGAEIVLEAGTDLAAWIAAHPEIAVGTIVVCALITYVVVTGGTGTPVLVALAAA